VGRRGAGPKEEGVGRRWIAGQQAEMGGGKVKGFKEVFCSYSYFKPLFSNFSNLKHSILFKIKIIFKTFKTSHQHS
jgi:hypothetical protein